MNMIVVDILEGIGIVMILAIIGLVIYSMVEYMPGETDRDLFDYDKEDK